MYILLNKLFGWDYVYWRNSADHGIARVHSTFYGVPYYFRYKNTRLIDTITQHRVNLGTILFLTCPPEKYLK